MERGLRETGRSQIKECFHLSYTRPFILRLALSAGVGGLLFGYDTGVISGALLYIRDDFASVEKNTSLQEAIVSTAIAGAIVGAAFGGWLNDKWGRRLSIMVADVLFLIGAIVMAVAQKPFMIIIGRFGVGLGIGMASMTSPLYISEASPARIRGALVGLNGLLITGGQFIAYLINLAFTKVPAELFEVPGTWRWMLGIAAVPAFVQLILMFFLPESPRWLFRKGRKEEAIEILERIYPAEEVTQEIQALKYSIDAEVRELGSVDEDNFIVKLIDVWSSEIVCRGLVAGIGVQIAQQFVGINTVMYYAPTVVQLAGYASNSTALALSLITSGLNVIGTLISMSTVDKFGRRKLMLISMVGIIICLYGLFAVFYSAAQSSPHVDRAETAHFANSTCPAFSTARDAATWSCTSCLEIKECGFCAHSRDTMKPGACLSENPTTRGLCKGEKRQWYTEGCPSRFGYVALIGLGAYIISYAPGMGTVPWIVNSEIYPLRHRGICGGIAAVANWVSNLIVCQTFLTLTDALGAALTFFVFGCISVVAFWFIFFFVPETKGLSFEEVEVMLKKKSLKHESMNPWEEESHYTW